MSTAPSLDSHPLTARLERLSARKRPWQPGTRQALAPALHRAEGDSQNHLLRGAGRQFQVKAQGPGCVAELVLHLWSGAAVPLWPGAPSPSLEQRPLPRIRLAAVRGTTALLPLTRRRSVAPGHLAHGTDTADRIASSARWGSPGRAGWRQKESPIVPCGPCSRCGSEDTAPICPALRRQRRSLS